MPERLFRTRHVAGEPCDVATARKVAAIVATLTGRMIGFSGCECSAVPVDVATMLLGYFDGFSRVICTAWAVTDPGVSSNAGRFAATSIFPQMQDLFVKLATDQVVASRTFDSGSIAGRADGEHYVASGHSGIALRHMLAKNFQIFCVHCRVAAAV
jgi:hypothetical protein